MDPAEEKRLLKKLKYETCLVTPVSSGSSLQSVSSEVLVQCGKPLSARIRRIKQLTELKKKQDMSTEDDNPARNVEEEERLGEVIRVENELLSEELRQHADRLNQNIRRENEHFSEDMRHHGRQLDEQRREQLKADTSGCSIL